LSAIFSNESSTFCALIVLRNSAPVMRGVAAWASAPDDAPPRGIWSISSIGVIPAIGSFANCHA
jgi:hypothetical protein